jgi:hypothetical protein
MEGKREGGIRRNRRKAMEKKDEGEGKDGEERTEDS